MLPGKTVTMSSRDFNQDTARAKKAATAGPVVITDRGRPSHVLLTYERYQELLGDQDNIVKLLAAPPGEAHVDFEPATLALGLKPADLD